MQQPNDTSNRRFQVVVEFIDETGGGPPPPPGLTPEDSALALATGAAALVVAAPRDRARALLMAGTQVVGREGEFLALLKNTSLQRKEGESCAFA